MSETVDEVVTFRWLTPPAPAAIAVLRLSGARPVLDRPLPGLGQACLAHLLDPNGAAVDEVVAIGAAGGVCDVCTHGGPGIRAAVNQALHEHGFLESADVAHDRWSRLARCVCPAARDWILAHDAAEPPFAAQYLERIPTVLITGGANAGKSSLLNAWCGHERAVVSHLPGTTRDLLMAEVGCGPWRLHVLDSAGLRATTDAIEQAGQDLVAMARARVDLVIHLDPADAPDPPRPGDLHVYGKADLGDASTGLGWAAPAYVGEARSSQMLADLELAVLAGLGLTC
ncbi:MAG: 50S ribosome-binding GTPase [Planctomycetota bacterium]|jgi:tRNA U34 5-carboxymethylaminomethyl modifying GTPase MnmE/TrmE|nr:50S ribosome-binding GTPase [Planctomycetota bacterium]